MINIPVGIIGAGPAGTTASLFLSQLGIDHLLIDRASFPRDKVCGESFDGKVFHLLKELNPEWLSVLKQEDKLLPCWAYSLTNSKGEKVSIRYPANHTPKIHIQRNFFDHFLLKKALESKYAKLYSNSNVQTVKANTNGVAVFTRDQLINCQMLIIATGATSLLKKTAGNTKKGKPYLFARQYFQGLTNIGVQPEVEIFYGSKKRKTCLLLNPLSTGITNVEIGIAKSDFLALNTNLKDLLKHAIQEARLSARFQTAVPVSQLKTTFMELPTGKRVCSKGRIYFAGASAGAVNPVTGYGVGHAMTMGKIAAQHISKCISAKDFSTQTLSAYDKAVKKKLRNEWLLSDCLTHLQ
ncbi:MAG: NAD(P)/FAD-dependent oxidoreductase [Bacteroidota bacterium]